MTWKVHVAASRQERYDPRSSDHDKSSKVSNCYDSHDVDAVDACTTFGDTDMLDNRVWELQLDVKELKDKCQELELVVKELKDEMHESESNVSGLLFRLENIKQKDTN